jgi:predicted component of type VI protein secretion system
MAHAMFTAELDRRELSDTVILGRGSDCDVVIADGLISRRHCRLGPSPQGWVLTDLQSSNGTHVHGERISRHLLKDGETFRIGRINVCFHCGESTAGHPHIVVYATHNEDEVSTGLHDMNGSMRDIDLPNIDDMPGLPSANHASQSPSHDSSFIAVPAPVVPHSENVLAPPRATRKVSSAGGDQAPQDRHAERERKWTEVAIQRVKAKQMRAAKKDALHSLSKPVLVMLAIGTAAVIFGITLFISSWLMGS